MGWPRAGPAIVVAMRVVIAGGGTGGHTSAGLAVAAALRARGDVEIAWIGTADGAEARRVPEAGIPFHAIPAGKLRRYWDRRNLTDLAWRVPLGLLAARRLLGQLRPAVVLGTGGFVSLPPAVAAWSRGIPVVVHEQTAVPGLANRLAARFATRVALSFPPAAAAGAAPAGAVVTGNPVRPEVRDGSREEGRRLLAFEPALPVVYVTGGSLGAHRINRAVGEALGDLLPRCQILHQCGDNPETGDRQWLAERAAALPPALRARYALRPYVGAELRHVYALASLVVGRSGAGTLHECCALGRPALYVPLPGASGDEQTANAREVERVGGARILPQSALTPAALAAAVAELLADPAALAAMGERARGLHVPDAAERLAALLQEAARR
jgi:UDP-N-acetylglucosamine--N-acetylmuramyl-(pentapeptide) pyrophosphoryl-undecaprenol N-acetylglucosamine transferase